MTTGCDDGVVAPGPADEGDFADIPAIPAEFSEMKSVEYRGGDPDNPDDLMVSLAYGLGNTSFSYIEFLENSSSGDVENVLNLFSYNSDKISGSLDDFSRTATIDVDKDTLTGTISATFDESTLFDYIKGSFSASVEHSNLLDLKEKICRKVVDGREIEYVVYDYSPAYVNDPETDMPRSLFEEGSFSHSVDLSDFDLKIRNAQGADGFVTEYFRTLAEIEFNMSGDSLSMGMPSQDGDSLSFASGTVDFDVDLEIRTAIVFSSSDTSVKGCKALCTISLEDALSDFDLSGIDVYDMDSLLEAIGTFLLQISVPTAELTVFDNDNNFLFSETVFLYTLLEDLIIP